MSPDEKLAKEVYEELALRVGIDRTWGGLHSSERQQWIDCAIIFREKLASVAPSPALITAAEACIVDLCPLQYRSVSDARLVAERLRDLGKALRER